MPEDISRYYTDLTDDDLVTRLALVHQRFSTNTSLHGTRSTVPIHVSHNGEINTLRGNVSRMRAREELMKVIYDDIKKYSLYWMENQTLLLWIWLSNCIDDWTLVTGSYDDGCT
jgi:glutamate synthase domain-containing protein 1